MHKYLNHKQKGYTLVEIIIVVGILMIISGGASLLFLTTQANNEREVVVNEVISLLRKQQLRAMNGEDQEVYGVHFEENKYVGFKGSTYVENDSNNIVSNLPLGVSFQSISLGSDSSIIYNKMTGEADTVGTISVVVRGVAGSKVISINNLGTVNVEIVE